MTRFNDLTLSEQGDKRARFDRLAEDIDAAVSGDSTIAGKVEALETAVGDSSSGLVKDVADIEATVGDAETANTLVHDVADIKTYISEILTTNSLTDPRANQGGDG